MSTHLRIACLSAVVTLTATIAMAETGNKGKSFGHKKDPVTLVSKGKDRLTGPNRGRKAAEVAVEFARSRKAELNIAEGDLATLKVREEFTDQHNGVTHIYLRQQIDGVEVAGGDLATHLTSEGEVISVSSTLVTGLLENERGSAALSPIDAAAAAARDLGLTVTEPLRVLEGKGGPQRETTLSTGGIASSPIVARLVYQPVADDRVRLAWNVEIEEASGEHFWSISVDAETGAILAGDDYVDHDNWHGVVPDVRRNANLARAATAASVVLRPAVQSSVHDGSAYTVFGLPLESPSGGPASMVMNPAEAVASPYGWHDTDAAPGPEFTRTRGNNVHAYVDAVSPSNVPDPGSDPDGGSSLQFHFPFDPTLDPEHYRPAAVVNLFYWNNIIHDIFYKYGFDEMSGNFQVNNYGRGPVDSDGNPVGGGDDVRAEAQDLSGLNNANFFTPIDGRRPRMQMYVWRFSAFVNTVEVHAPSPIAGFYTLGQANFGPPFTTSGVSGTVVQALDAADGTGPSTTDGCTAFTNAAAIAGNIALVDRGSCPFVTKVSNAQAAGAVAVLIGNNVAGNPVTLGGADNSITIPSGMISLDDTGQFKANLPFEATAARRANLPPDRDSDFDALIITHEYGHGISNRLTGGRTVNCLNSREQMGEGWSDWLGLVLTADPSDTPETPRGVGNYVLFQDRTDGGIRPTQYSTDMDVNPSTYDTIRGVSVPHGVGYVWATMLWDMYWNLVEKYGYNPNVYEPWHTGGNNLAIQLVMDGMKLQPCRPGFVDGRDAILQADINLTGGANQCEIWKAFAKRGLGFGASQGSSGSVLDGTESFIADGEPPVISNVAVSHPTLWSPNHKMVDITVSYDVDDICAVTTSLSVTSNEPAGSNEQGDVDGDWEVVDNHLVRLRAERLGTGDGRVYTITITATDASGLSSTATATVTVPKNQR